MEHLIASWPQTAHEIKQRHFTASPRSVFYVHDVCTNPDRSVEFTWRYVWLDLGMFNSHSRRVLVKHGEGGTLLVQKYTDDLAGQPSVCDLASLEDACFRDECQACHHDNLMEIMGTCCF